LISLFPLCGVGLCVYLVARRRVQRSIALQTTAGNDIPNEQYLEIDDTEWGKVQLFQEKYGATLQKRTNPTGIYNCHGMVFGSRRTSLYDGTFLATILKDDYYSEVKQEDVIAGDVILYFEKNVVSHSGIVVEK